MNGVKFKSSDPLYKPISSWGLHERFVPYLDSIKDTVGSFSPMMHSRTRGYRVVCVRKLSQLSVVMCVCQSEVVRQDVFPEIRPFSRSSYSQSSKLFYSLCLFWFLQSSTSPDAVNYFIAVFLCLLHAYVHTHTLYMHIYMLSCWSASQH